MKGNAISALVGGALGAGICVGVNALRFDQFEGYQISETPHGVLIQKEDGNLNCSVYSRGENTWVELFDHDALLLKAKFVADAPALEHVAILEDKAAPTQIYREIDSSGATLRKYTGRSDQQ